MCDQCVEEKSVVKDAVKDVIVYMVIPYTTIDSNEDDIRELISSSYDEIIDILSLGDDKHIPSLEDCTEFALTVFREVKKDVSTSCD